MNWFQDFLHRVAPRLSTLRNECIWIWWYTTQLWYTFHNSHSILVIVFSSFWDVALFRLFIWLFINLVMRKQTLVSSLTTRFNFIEWTLGRMPIFTRRSRAGTFQKNTCTVVEEWHHGYSCLVYFSSSTHFDLVIRLAQKVWRQCVLVFAHDLGFRGGNCNGLLANIGFFLPTGNRYLFLFQRRSIPFDSLPLLLFQFSHAWRQSFVIEVSDLFSSPWFSTFDSWEPISSDESPCRTILIRFWVARTHIFSISQTFQDIIRWHFWHRQ